ncbi:MAG TPA: ATP-binding cassette domain-containing protein [Thermoanaerobaculia bacterium]|nr:ATP-binding cassette domain-containing protein [Thermoanaerobaculia bacterium]
MLDLFLRGVSYRHPKSGFILDDITLDFPRGEHSAVIGLPSSGVSTLLRIIAGDLQPARGDVIIGTRRVNGLPASRRPLLFLTGALLLPGRWSVQHALVAAVRTRSLDRQDRQIEYEQAVEKWSLRGIEPRRLDSLATSERLRVHLARTDLLRPGIVVADRLLRDANPSEATALADAIYRLLRATGTTVVSAPASLEELRHANRVIVIDGGRVVQVGTPAEVHRLPSDPAAARASGEVNTVPVTIRGTRVESAIGTWDVASPPFQGEGFALLRPDDFTLAAPGEESDLILAIEEAGFATGRWHVRGFLTGGMLLHVALPPSATIHKGRLLPLRFDPGRVLLRPAK